MKTSSERMENCQVALNVELESSEKDKYIDLAFQHLAKEVTIPGFRKGKAPRTLIEKRLGKEAVIQEALEHLIPEVYEEALKSEAIMAIAEPQIELVKIDPVTFKAIVPVKPNVTLGNYKDVRLAMEKKDINDKEIDQVIEQLREQFGTLMPVERSVQYGDVVIIDIEGKKGAEAILNRKDAFYDVQRESKFPVPGFSEKLINLNKGAEENFTLTFPQDFEISELSGKEYSFIIKIKDIKEKNLPELNDEFAKTAGSENLNDLKEKIRTNLQSRVDEQARKEFENKLVGKLIEQSTLEFPPILVEKEVDHIINEESRNFQDGIKGLENYLKNAKKTMEEHRGDLRPGAENRVKAYLIISKIAEAENVIVNEDELNHAVENMVKGDEKRADNVKALFDLPQPRESLRETMVINKTMDLLTKKAVEST
jgi:trigger factor